MYRIEPRVSVLIPRRMSRPMMMSSPMTRFGTTTMPALTFASLPTNETFASEATHPRAPPFDERTLMLSFIWRFSFEATSSLTALSSEPMSMRA